jgi:hypothetical protein
MLERLKKKGHICTCFKDTFVSKKGGNYLDWRKEDYSPEQLERCGSNAFFVLKTENTTTYYCQRHALHILEMIRRAIDD